MLYLWRGIEVIRQRFQAENHPYWADPEYAYLLNGQAWLNGKVIFHIDHPGTPVQIFNGLYQWLVWKLDIYGTGDLLLEESVVQAAELHQLGIAIILTLTQAALIYVIALIWAKKESPWTGVLTQIFMVALSLPLMQHLIANKPEGFILVYLTAAICFLVISWGPNSSLRFSFLIITSFSLVLALALTSKISSLLVVGFIPLALFFWRKIAGTYFLILVFSLLVLQIIWPMLPTAWRFWTTSTGAFANPTSLVLLAFFPPQSPVLTFLVMLLGVVSVGFFLSLWQFLLKRRATATKGEKFIRSQRLNQRLLVFYATSIVIIVGQVLIATARNLPWVVPAIPVAALAVSLALTQIFKALTVSDSIMRVRGRSELAMTATVIISVVALVGISPLGDSSAQGDEIQAAETQWQSSGDLVVYDWSLAWGDLPYGGVCASLIFGDGFARQVVSPILQSQCTNHRMGIFTSTKEIQPYGNGSVSCEGLREDLIQGRRIAFLTPRDASLPSFASEATVAESRGWRFVSVQIENCSGQ